MLPEHPNDLTLPIRILTAWLREEKDFTAARIALFLRQLGVDSKTVWCVKIFPDLNFPESGVVITPQKDIYQFGFNRFTTTSAYAGFDEWNRLTGNFQNHEWRDAILAGLELLKN